MSSNLYKNSKSGEDIIGDVLRLTRSCLGDGNRKAEIEQFVDPGAKFRGEDSIATSDTLHQASLFTRQSRFVAACSRRKRKGKRRKWLHLKWIRNGNGGPTDVQSWGEDIFITILFYFGSKCIFNVTLKLYWYDINYDIFTMINKYQLYLLWVNLCILYKIVVIRAWTEVDIK